MSQPEPTRKSEAFYILEGAVLAAIFFTLMLVFPKFRIAGWLILFIGLSDMFRAVINHLSPRTAKWNEEAVFSGEDRLPSRGRFWIWFGFFVACALYYFVFSVVDQWT